MVLQPQFLRPRNQTVAVSLVAIAQKMRVGGAHHHINGIGRMGEDRRHGLDHRLDTLAGADQAKGQQHGAAAIAQPLFGALRCREGRVGNAMRNDDDLAGISAIGFDQDVAALVCHHNHPRGGRQNGCHYHPLRPGWLIQHGMQRGDQRDFQRRDQPQNKVARNAAINAKFVLQTGNIEVVAIDEIGRGKVLIRLVLVNAEADRRRPDIGAARITHGKDSGVGNARQRADRLLKIGGEGRNPTAPWQGIADKGNPQGTRHQMVNQCLDGHFQKCVHGLWRRQNARPAEACRLAPHIWDAAHLDWRRRAGSIADLHLVISIWIA